MPNNERRNLYYAFDEGHDPSITLDVNEYLIDEWPTLSLKARRAVWTVCQNNEDFDLSAIEDQIDDAVYTCAEQNPELGIELPDDDEEDEDSDDEDLKDALHDFVSNYYDEDLDDEELQEYVDDLFTMTLEYLDGEDGDDSESDDDETLSDNDTTESTD